MRLYRDLTLGRRSPFVLLTVCLASLAGCDQSPETAAPSPVAYGVKIGFGKNGEAAHFKTSGWQQAEDEFTWTDGTSAVLTMRVAPTAAPVTLKMTMAGMIKPPELVAQSVGVYVNEDKIADWQVGDPALFTASIPGEVTRKGGTLHLLLEIPKATAPKQLGVSEDPRVLGVRVFDLELAAP